MISFIISTVCGGDHLAFTLKNLIYDCGLSNIRLLTCLEAANSPIKSLNVIDNPDVSRWITPGQLVLTTGYFFANDPNLQTNVIMNLKSAGCCALCIKTGRFFLNIPENILKTAEQVGLPVIDIPFEYTFGEIIGIVHEHLNNHKFLEIQQEQILLGSLLNTFSSEHSLQDCLKLLSDYLLVSLFIVDQQFRCLFYYLQPEDQMLCASPDHFKIDSTDETGPAGVIHGIMNVSRQKKIVALIPFQNQRHFLCVPDEKLSLPLSFIQNAMKLLRFPEKQFSRYPASLSEYYCSFFQLLLSNGMKNNVDSICEYYGYPHCPAQLCILFSLRHKKKENESLQAPIAYLKKILSDISCPPSSFFLAFYQRQICLFLFSVKDFCQMAAQCINEFQNRFGSSFLASASQVFYGDREIIKAYQQASFLLSLADLFPEKDTFLFNNYMLFWYINELSTEAKHKIYQNTVKPLVDYDAKNNADLVKTLHKYFESNFNASLASKALYIHRNTLLKRIQKINELVPINFENINNLMSFYCGLCIYLLEQY